jgi:hypothetical protein
MEPIFAIETKPFNPIFENLQSKRNIMFSVPNLQSFSNSEDFISKFWEYVCCDENFDKIMENLKLFREFFCKKYPTILLDFNEEKIINVINKIRNSHDIYIQKINNLNCYRSILFIEATPIGRISKYNLILHFCGELYQITGPDGSIKTEAEFEVKYIGYEFLSCTIFSMKMIIL